MAGTKEVQDLGILRDQVKELEDSLHNQTNLEVEEATKAQALILQARINSLQKYAQMREAAEQSAAKRIAALNLTVDKDTQTKKLKDATDRIEEERKAALAAAKKANGGKKLTAEETAKINAEYAARQKAEEKNLKAKFAKEEKQAAKIQKQETTKEAAKQRDQAAQEAKNDIFGKGKTLTERAEALAGMFKDEDGNTDIAKGLSESLSLISDFAASLKSDINSIAGNKSAIDTRLQGSKNTTKAGSYWDKFSSDIVGVAGVSPLVKQSTVVEKLKDLVGQGISFNVEQRAFLESIKDKIATTFSVTDAALVKLVRIQQQDTTAARLGMESALTSFLNNMYETTEYMQSAASTIRSSIYEASALMSSTAATEFEYQVQKWMGSLYSVGFNEDSTTGLAAALGNLAAGNVSSITDGSYGNLLVMAANKANLSIADMLSEGLDASDTNQLMQAMVEYLGQIYSETKGSNLLAQQYASVFGLKASDLKAAANLSTSINNISNQNLSYGGMITQLNTMADSMYSRTSYGELLSNSFDNLKYTMAASIANNPALYAVYTLASMLKDVTGGIDFSLPTVMGTGMAAQTFNVADILLSGTLAGGLLSGIGSMISAGSGGGFSGSGMLSAMGIGSGVTSVARGNGSGLISTSGASVSSSGYVGNADGSDVQNKTMTETTDSSNSQTVSASEETDEKTMTDVDESIIKIYTLLQDVVAGTQTIKVDMGNEAAWTSAIKSGNTL